MSSLGNAAQLSFSSGPFTRGDISWIARATSSLPVPRSPVTSTFALLFAARAICSSSRLIAPLSPTKSPVVPAAFRNARASASARSKRSAVSTVMRSASVLSGFSRKLSAPSRVARTAVSIVACPLIMMTGTSTFAARRRCSKSTPSPSGSCTSKRHKS